MAATVKYAVPSGVHDDSVMSLALAVHAFHSSRGMILGLVDLMKHRARQIAEGVRDMFGELVAPKPEPVRKPKPLLVKQETRVEGFETWQRTGRAPACKACGNTSTRFNELREVSCNQCHSIDGVPPPPVAENGLCWVPDCGLPLRQIANVWYCMNHGQAPILQSVPRGATFRDLKRSRCG